MASNNNGRAETALIACAAAGIGTYLALQLSKKDDQQHRDDGGGTNGRHYGDKPPTFLQAGRTKTLSDEEMALQPRGWTMAEALEHAQKKTAMTAFDVLQSLQKGNSRFWTGQARRPELSAFERRSLIKQQFPSTAVLGCSDSRVPVEIVFDQGLGDMFVVRVAGNCLGPTTQASLDYAVHHLNVKVLLVMGHEGCGAIKAAGLPPEQIQKETKSLASVLTSLKEGLTDLPTNMLDPRARDREAVATNVRRQITDLVEDPQLLAKVNDGSLVIVGAFYEISSGIVDFFMQVSKLEGKDRRPATGVLSRYHPDSKEIVYA